MAQIKECSHGMSDPAWCRKCQAEQVSLAKAFEPDQVGPVPKKLPSLHLDTKHQKSEIAVPIIMKDFVMKSGFVVTVLDRFGNPYGSHVFAKFPGFCCQCGIRFLKDELIIALIDVGDPDKAWGCPSCFVREAGGDVLLTRRPGGPIGPASQ